jgi:hypothetical protein
VRTKPLLLACFAVPQRKDLTLEDLFAVLDTDLDGALEADTEMLGLIMKVTPNLAATDALYFLVRHHNVLRRY